MNKVNKGLGAWNRAASPKQRGGDKRGKKEQEEVKHRIHRLGFQTPFSYPCFKKRACLGLYDGPKGVLPETSLFASHQERLNFSIGEQALPAPTDPFSGRARVWVFQVSGWQLGTVTFILLPAVELIVNK